MSRSVATLALIVVAALAGACDAAQPVAPPVAASLGVVTPTGTPSIAPTGAASSPTEAPDVDTPDEDAGSASPDATPSPSSAPPAASGSIAGTWTGSWRNDPQWGDAHGGFALDLTQDGSDFSGSIDVSGPTCVRHGTTSGTLHGSHISFGIVAAGVRNVDFEGTLSGDAMSGTWTMIACGVSQTISGSWGAER